MVNGNYYEELLRLTSLRGTGKSELLGQGVHYYKRPFIVVCNNIEQGMRLTDKNPHANYVTPNNINRLRGTKLPIIFDQEVVLEYLEEILVLKSEIRRLKMK